MKTIAGMFSGESEKRFSECAKAKSGEFEMFVFEKFPEIDGLVHFDERDSGEVLARTCDI